MGPSWTTEKSVMDHPIFSSSRPAAETKTIYFQGISKKDIGISVRRLNVGRDLFKSGTAIIRHYARARDGDYV